MDPPDEITQTEPYYQRRQNKIATKAEKMKLNIWGEHFPSSLPAAITLPHT